AEFVTAQASNTETDGGLTDERRARLRDLPTVELPADRLGPASADEAGRSVSLVLDPALSQSIRVACRDQNRTLFNHLLAAFESFVRRFIEDDDVVVASPMMTRSFSDHRQTVGPFVGLAVFRNTVRMEQTFREVAAAVRDEVASSLDPDRAPLEDVLQDLGL